MCSQSYCFMVIRKWLVDNLLQGCTTPQTCYKLFQHIVITLQLARSNLKISISLQLVDKLATSSCFEHIFWTSCEIFTCVILPLELLSAWQSVKKEFFTAEAYGETNMSLRLEIRSTLLIPNEGLETSNSCLSHWWWVNPLIHFLSIQSTLPFWTQKRARQACKSL